MFSDWMNPAADLMLPVLLDWAAKGLIVLTGAGVATLLMRKASASARHLVWALAITSVLLLPVLSAALPGWGVLPRWMFMAEEKPLPALPAAQVMEPMLPAPAEPLSQPMPRIEALASSPSAAPVPAPLPPPQPLKLPAWLVLGWIAGAGVTLCPVLLSYLMLRRLRRIADPIDSDTWPMLLHELKEQLNLSRPVLLLGSSKPAMPMTWGIFRPVLLLPHISRQWTAERRRIVLVHELAHVKRRDCLWQLLGQLACGLYWFNPLVWLALKQMQAERERACDDLVLGGGIKGSQYAEQLLEIASNLQAHRMAGYSAIAMARPSKLEGRLLAILDSKRNRKAITWAGVIVAVIVAAAVALPVAILRAGDGQKDAGPAAPLAQPAATQPTTTLPATATDPPGTIKRVYDVRDLLADVPDSSNPPELGVRSEASTRPAAVQPAPASTQATRDRLLHDLIVRITSSIDPLSWRDNTGSLGSVRELSGQLIITQTPANHERIARLIEDLRGARAIQVTVEARFLSSSSRSADKLLKSWGENWMTIEGSDFQMCPRFLDGPDVDELLRTIQADKNSMTLTVPRITLFNGQRSFVLVSTQTAYVADLKRVGSGESDRSYEPVVGVVDSGVVLDCRAQVSPDHRFVTLTLAPQLARLMDLRSQRWPGSTPGHEETIQVPTVRKVTLTTTITMPDGKYALYRRPDEVAQVEVAPGVAKPMQSDTLLLVKPTIISKGGETVPGSQSAATRPAALVLIEPATQPSSSPATGAVAPQAEVTRAKLDKRAAWIQFDNTRFADVIEFLRNASGANILVNWRAIEAAGVGRNTPINARLRDARISHVLDTVLRKAGGETIKLGYMIEDNGVVTITTKDDLAANVMTRVYDVRDLFPENADDDAKERARVVARLEQLIRDTVEWDRHCAMRELSGQLIITAQPELHENIAALIEQLRETRSRR